MKSSLRRRIRISGAIAFATPLSWPLLGGIFFLAFVRVKLPLDSRLCVSPVGVARELSIAVFAGSARLSDFYSAHYITIARVDLLCQDLYSGFYRTNRNMSRTGRPREFDRDEALQRAMELFWAQGYEGATLADLQKAMGGITAPSFYAAFGSKE